MCHAAFFAIFAAVFKVTASQTSGPLQAEILYNYKKCYDLLPRQVTLPWEEWPKANREISLSANPVAYNDAKIESALQEDRELLDQYYALIHDFYPKPYVDPLEYTQPEDYVCEDICPGIYRNATAVLIAETAYRNGKARDVVHNCNIVRPWEQVVPFMACLRKTPAFLDLSADSTLYCVPNSFVDRQIVVYCESRVPQCLTVRMQVPLGCSCASIKCRDKKRITSQSGPVAAGALDFLSLLGLQGK